MKIEVYSQKGTKLKTKLDLNPAIFGVEPNEDLMAQYVRVYLANQRAGTAKTKTRGEVSGGGRKPWPQKGTGRARHGSIRSPIWVKGGIAHGPRPRDWALKISKKMRRVALFSALSSKLAGKAVKIISKVSLPGIKTKELAKVLSDLKLSGNILLVLDSLDQNVILSARNIPGVRTIQARELNAYEVLDCNWLVMTKKAVEVLEKTFVSK